MKYLKKTAVRLSFLFFLLFAIAVPIFPADSPVNFYGAKAFGDGGIYYRRLKDCDFNGDGRIDVLAASYSEILVFFGDGSGEFSLPPLTVFSSGGGDIFPTGGDFNNDGRSDIIFTNHRSPNGLPSIGVMFGKADKTFSQAIYSDQETVPAGTIPVDFDNDGKLDLVGAPDRSSNNAIIFYKGGDDGTFTIGGQLRTDYSNVRDITISDLNNDGLPDVSYGESDYLKVSRNMGNGIFGAPIIVGSIDYGFYSSEMSDVNNDGKKDIVAVQNTFSNPTVAVWFGNSDFTFSPSSDFVISTQDTVYLEAIVDLNNDQKQDLIFKSNNRILVKKGIGNGTFAEDESYIDGGGDLFVKDINADGWLDIVTAQSAGFPLQGSGSFSVLINLQNGYFKSALSFKTGDETKDIAVSDFNADGLNDFVVVNRGGGGGSGDIIIVQQTASSNFTEKNSSRFAEKNTTNQMKLAGNAGIDPYAVVAGDINQDGKKDIVVVGHASSSAAKNALVLLNLGNNDFSPILFQIGTSYIYDVAAADLNSDGRLDLVTSGYLGVSVSFGNGDGTFRAPVNYLVNVLSSQITIGDFNNDLKNDVAIVSYAANKIGILINNGNGTFTNNVNLSIFYQPSGVASADMNADGKLDLVVSKGNGISILTGVGDGTFINEVSYSITPFSASGLVVADFNGDEKPDVALMASSNTISVLINNGFGGLGDETLWGGGAVLSTIAVSDFNNDGKNDLITGFTAFADGYVKLLFNLTERSTISRKVLFDFDGDSKSDISVFRPESGVWHLQQSQSGYAAPQFGLATDKLVPADYDGDGKTDLAVFRENPSDPGKAKFFILQSSNNQLREEQLGSTGDISVAADWDGDGKTDVGVYRAGTEANQQGYFYYRPSSQPTVNFVPYPWGIAGDKPVVADFDGDGKTDPAVFRPSNGAWYIQRSRDGFYAIQFGAMEDKPVVGDYDGDGKADQAVFRPSNGVWYIWNSTTGFSAAQFGVSTDKPVPADYDGDGRTDIAVYRDGNWFLLNSRSGFASLGFGNATDKPLPNSFVP